MNQQNIFCCKNCRIPYAWRRSPSGSLKMTYCCSLCERSDLGFTIEALLNYSTERSVLRELREKAAAAEEAALAVA